MKFKSLILSEGRGSLGGATFSRNGNAAYIRAKAIPVNPRSIGQTTSRGRLNVISSAWRSLTDEQRTSWGALAATVPYQNSVGDTAYYSGFQLYMKLSLVLLNMGSLPPTDAPAVAPTYPVIVMTNLRAEQDATVFTDFSLNAALTVAVLLAGTGFTLDVQSTRSMSAGRSFIPDSEYKRVLTLSNPVTTGVLDLTGGYASAYGTPELNIIGSVINVRYRLVETATGFTSPWVKLRTAVFEA